MSISIKSKIMRWYKEMCLGEKKENIFRGVDKKTIEEKTEVFLQSYTHDKNTIIKELLFLSDIYSDEIIEHIHKTREKIISAQYVDAKLDFFIKAELSNMIKSFVRNIDMKNIKEEIKSFFWLMEALISSFVFEEEIWIDRYLNPKNNPSHIFFMNQLLIPQEQQKVINLGIYEYWASSMLTFLCLEDKTHLLFYKDTRTWGAYISSVCEGWIFEEIIKNFLEYHCSINTTLNNKKITSHCFLNGADANRQLKNGSKKEAIDGAPDLEVQFKKTINDKTIKLHTDIELQKSIINFKNNPYNVVHIKVHKFKKSLDNDSLIFLIFPYTNTFSIFHAKEFAGNKEVMTIQTQKSWGGKKVHNISLKNLKKVGIYSFNKEENLQKLVKKIFAWRKEKNSCKKN